MPADTPTVMSNPNEPSTPATELAVSLPAVLFADISGSTMLYDKLGDTAAKMLVDECLDIMRSVTLRRGGRVIKTIGDELMCVFPDADRGSLAATDMQLAVSTLPAASGVRRAIRVGLHAGPLIQEQGDVFGDTVNTAARMASLAKANQIITTGATVMLMSPLLRSSTRHIAALAVRGKGDEVEVCEVLWQPSDELTMAASFGAQPNVFQRLRLTHGSRNLSLEAGGGFVAIGRDPTCHIALTGRKASRLHARIEWRRDKFFLIDQSTNGTYVTFVDEDEVVLRREEVMLRGQGFICFGHSIADSAEETVDFLVQ
jgi:class 3 adenylate cyclase